MVKVVAIPIQLPRAGVTVMVAVCWLVTVAPVKLISPVPEAAKPMAVLELFHEKVAPVLPEKFETMLAPPQATTFVGWFMEGAGVTVSVKFCVAPVHPFALGVTVIVPVVGAPTVAAVKLILPVPEAPNPMAVLELFQVKDGLPVPVKFTETAAPEHTV